MLTDIINYLEISPQLGTAGQPAREQFDDLRAAGYTDIINLAMPQPFDGIADEAEITARLGLRYRNIPVVWKAPTAEKLAEFFAEMDARREGRVLVHCALNYRVSSFVFLYRVLRLGVNPDAAREDLYQIWQPEGIWEWFIAERVHNNF